MYFEQKLLLLVLMTCFQIIPMTSGFRASSISIVPEIMTCDRYSVYHLKCTNMNGNHSNLQIELTKNISSNEVSISSTPIDHATIDITLEIKDYVGTFHLLCYEKGARSSGIRSDVIVKAAPSTIQQEGKCRVYQKRYLKCAFRAPGFARALANDYPVDFQFTEMTRIGSPRLYSDYQLVKGETTDQILVFKWIPLVEGRFPPDLRMRLDATLKFFEPSVFFFDTSPIYIVEPVFGIRKTTHNQIYINLKPSVNPVHCQISVQESYKIQQTLNWSNVAEKAGDFLINHLIPNTEYDVCLRCQEQPNDPPGEKVCEKTKTGSRFERFFTFNLTFYIFLGVIALLFMLFAVLIWKKPLGKRYWRVNDRKTLDGNNYADSMKPSRYSDSRKPSRSSNESMDFSDSLTDEGSQKDNGSDSYKRLSSSGKSFLNLCDIQTVP